ncbi:MAG: tetratricopeptide repeat protein, partial [Actinomycetota bacterium]
KELVVPHEPSSFSDEPEFSFRHVLIRDGAYDSLPKALRADKHAGVARWAEQRAGDRADEIAELIATHLLEALRYLEELGETGERRDELRRDAFRWTKGAGERTLALWLKAEAARWFREAERLADALELSPQERVELVRAHVEASWGTDPVPEHERVVRAAQRVFEALDDQLAVGWTWTRLVIPLLMLGRDGEAEAAGRIAVSTLEPFGERAELADALHRLGWYLWRRGRNEEAEPLLRRSAQMAARVGAREVHAEATQTLAVCLSQMGRSAEALETIEEAFRLAKEVGDVINLVRCYNNLTSLVSDLASDNRRAEEVVREGLELVQRVGARQNEGWLTGTLGDVLARLGRLQEAEECQRRAIEGALSVGDEPLRGMRLTALAGVLLLRGRLDEAEAAHRESLPILEANPEPQSQLFIPWTEGFLALLRGANEEAAERLAECVEMLREFNVEGYPEVFPDTVRALLRGGRAAEAEQSRDLSEHGRSPAARANAALVEGLLSKYPSEARRLLSEGVAALEELEFPIDAARAMVDLGRVIARAGENPTPVLERAREILVECDARAFLFEVDAAVAGR